VQVQVQVRCSAHHIAENWKRMCWGPAAIPGVGWRAGAAGLCSLLFFGVVAEKKVDVYGVPF
jgi:hypothetical protein